MCWPANLPDVSPHLPLSPVHILQYQVAAILYALSLSLNCMEQVTALSPTEVPSSKDILQFRSGSGNGQNVTAAPATQPTSSIKPMSQEKDGWAVVIM